MNNGRMINTVALSDKQRTKQLTIAILLVGIMIMVYSVFAVYASGLGGYISEKLISSSGTTNSALVIDRFGVSGSNLDVTMGPIVTTLSATNIFIDGMGQSHATLRGTLTSLNGFPISNVWFEWGYSTAYGTATATQVANALGIYTATITNYDPAQTVYYRFVGQTDGTSYSGATIIYPATTPGIGGGSTFAIINGAGATSTVSLLSVVSLLFAVAILLFMLHALRETKNPIVLVIILGLLIFAGIALLSGFQQLMNNLF